MLDASGKGLGNTLCLSFKLLHRMWHFPLSLAHLSFAPLSDPYIKYPTQTSDPPIYKTEKFSRELIQDG